MDERALRLLELDKILARLENAAACDLGRSRVRELVPETAPATVRRRLAETTQARSFVHSFRYPPFGGVSDIGAHLKRARIGALLEPPDLQAVGRFASGIRRLRETIVASETQEYPLLHGYAEGLMPQPAVEKAIEAAIDDASGEIKDDASLRLLKARRNIRQTQNSVQTRLRQMLSDPHVQPLLQDNFVTVRDGRYCLPVRAECRTSVPGIVHDRSGSGGAFFIEPQAVVEMNNKLRELMSEEREAITEILTDLTRRVAGVHDELDSSLLAAGDLDFAFAKANLSEAMKAMEPRIEDPAQRAGFALLQARHPLVEKCVPNDIFLGDDSAVRGRIVREEEAEASDEGLAKQDFDVILITGPNTGGKTVILKTLGLMACMAACGMHLPVAPGSWLSVPGAVYADIGDEQSIEQSLSTFSSHMKNIIHILKHSRQNDLVLFDEIGAGTDPDEGAALAKAVLRSLQRRGTRVLATTHYGELKQFALGAARFENASVEFDSHSLRPTYRLRISVPGASNALEIAARLGMPNDLVLRARRYLGRERAEAEAAVQKLEETQRELSEQTEGAQRERSEVERLRREYETKLAKLQARADEQLARAQREAEELVRTAQREADAVLRELRQVSRESKRTEEARGRLKSLRERVDAQKGRVNLRPESIGAQGNTGQPARINPVAPGAKAVVLTEPIKVVAGEIVLVKTLNKEGTVLVLPDDNGRVQVRVGAVKVQVSISDLEKVKQAKNTVGGVNTIRLRKAVNVAEEINLIGKNGGEAIVELEKYLDDALLAEAEEVRVIHGRGSGALRTAIHRWLKNQHVVEEFHLAPPNLGGEGATIVKLA